MDARPEGKGVLFGHAHAVETCGERFYPARCGCGRRLLPETCKDRLCPHCERARAAKAVKRYEPCFRRREWVRLVTLTVRRFPHGHLAESIGLFVKWFRALRHRYPDVFEGGVYSIETKGKGPHRDDPGGWHTHVHVLAWGCYLDQAELSAAWEKVTKGRGRVVDIRAARRDVDGTFDSALREVLKYVTKSPVGAKDDDGATSGWNAAMVAEFYAATKHRRLLSKFGSCPAAAELEPIPCKCCGEPLRKVGGFRALSLCREDAERWAAELDPHNDWSWSLADERAAADERRRFEGSPAP